VLSGGMHPWAIEKFMRLWTTALSLVHDALVVGLARAAELPTGPALAVWATLWPTLVFQSRAFSNTYEVFWLTLSATLACGACGPVFRGPHARSVAFGASVALGTFTRVTMLAYAAPFAVLLFADVALGLHDRQRLDVAAAQTNVWQAAARVAKCVAFTSAGFAFAASAAVALDTMYFGVTGWPVVAPWNLLWFNASPTNVARFGLHPWWLHAGVNLHFLVGPAALMLASSLTLGRGHLLTQRWPSPRQGRENTRVGVASGRAVLLRTALVASACVGIAALSLAAHQEPRFLLPATLGIALVASPAVWNIGSVAWRIFITCHLCVAVFYSCVHQAGVIPMLAAKAAERDSLHHVLV
jgi:phosphatidylinositol glycan class Z